MQRFVSSAAAVAAAAASSSQFNDNSSRTSSSDASKPVGLMLLPVPQLLSHRSAPQREQRRGLFTMWHMSVYEPEVTKGAGWLARLTNTSNMRMFNFYHTPVVEPPPLGGNGSVPAPSFIAATTCSPPIDREAVEAMTGPELYLYSAIIDDTNRLISMQWAVDHDAFWRDRVISHEYVYRAIYGKEPPTTIFAKEAASEPTKCSKCGTGVCCTSLFRMLMGGRTKSPKANGAIDIVLNRLHSVLYWAQETEKVTTAIYKIRFKMQREIFEPFEREKILAACVDIVEEFKHRPDLPSEFRNKTVQELECQISGMRHWITDCPNAKRTYKRILA